MNERKEEGLIRTEVVFPIWLMTESAIADISSRIVNSGLPGATREQIRMPMQTQFSDDPVVTTDFRPLVKLWVVTRESDGTRIANTIRQLVDVESGIEINVTKVILAIRIRDGTSGLHAIYDSPYKDV